MDVDSLADILQKKEEEILKLRDLIKEKDENLTKAGEFGNGLLERNQILEKMWDDVQQDHIKVVEEYEQEKYSLENKLEVMTKMKSQIECTLQEESQRWKAELAKLNETQRQGVELKSVKRHLEDVTNQLQQEKLMSAQRLETIELKNCQIQKLQNEIRQTSFNDTLSSEVAELSSENCDLKLRLQELEVTEQELSNMIQHMKTMLEASRGNEDRLREAKEDAEKEVSSSYAVLENCREQCRELQVELELLKMQPNDPNARGNSLFAEVEDRRIQAERNLVSMKSRYKCMQSQVEQQKHYTLKLKMQISTLLQTRSRTLDQQHVRSLEEMLSVAHSDNSKLQQKVQTLQDKLNSREYHAPDVNIGDSAAVVKFFKNELKLKSAEVDRVSEELRLSELHLMNETKRVSFVEREVYELGKQLDVVKAEKFQLQIEIDRLKIKCGEDVKVKMYRHKYKSEKIIKEQKPKEDAEESKADERENTENKENEKPKDDMVRISSEDSKAEQVGGKKMSDEVETQSIEVPTEDKHNSRQPLVEKELPSPPDEHERPAPDYSKLSIPETERHDKDAVTSSTAPRTGREPVKAHKINRDPATTAADCIQQ